MHRRWKQIAGVIVAIGVVVALVLLARQYTMPPRLPIERTALGKVPPSALRNLVDRGRCRLLPTDLDDDGEPELLISFGTRPFGANPNPQAVSVWTDLQGEFVEAPYDIAYPYYASTLAPEILPLKEVVGRDRAHKQLLRLKRAKNRWVEAIVAGSPTTQVYNPHWRDSDGDGYLDAIVARLKGTSPVHLQLTPQSRWRPAPQRRLSAALPVSFLNSNPQLAPDFAQLGLKFWLGDVDGDGAPDLLDSELRALILKSGKTVFFSTPPSEWEQFVLAELDGRAPNELVGVFQSGTQSAMFTVYRFQNDALVEVNHQVLPLVHQPYCYARDIDGDGKTELFFGGLDSRAPRFAIIGFREDKGTLRENYRKLITSVQWRASATREYVQPRDCLVFTAVAEQGWVRRKLEVHTILTAFGKGTAERTILLRGELIWAGDYDSDGYEEYVLRNSSGGVIAQLRDGAWYVTEITRAAPIAAAIALQRQGKLQLILVYHDGVIEAMQIKR
jgi:hypothetical protein